ncbi:MAG: EAL domain-containing protein (putative c-di-GMP-specific phosphodiesterase class I) [Pseudomonadales bacterium]|jgi:EAL domain-containing protein (putative c-di-GMP-specific phosphodiesterase class I)
MDIGLSSDDDTLVKSTVRMSPGLKRKVLVEGVETQAQKNFVKACGGDSVQGFLYGSPMPVAQLQEFLITKATV